MPVQVFRVQDKHGRGPWKPGFSHKWSEDKPESYYAKYQPISVEFAKELRTLLNVPGQSYGCGCLSREMLQGWFTRSEYEKLKELGYRAVKIGAERIVARSQIQCLFACYGRLSEMSEEIELYPCEANNDS